VTGDLATGLDDAQIVGVARSVADQAIRLALKLVPTESRASTEVRALAADSMSGLGEAHGLELHAVSPELRAELHHLRSRVEVFLHEAKSAGGR